MERDWELWVNVAYKLMSARDIYGSEIAAMLRRHGKDPDAPEWRDYLPAPLHYMTWLAYVRRMELERQEYEQSSKNDTGA